MPDLRELFDNPEEAFRSMWAGLQKHLHTSMVAQVTEASDGKTVTALPTIKQQVLDPTLTETTYADYPVLPDVPVHFPGGAGVTLTHGIAKGDEILTIFASRPHDTWFQSGDTQQPISDRTHSLSDGLAIPGLRSTPRALQQIDTQAGHLRSDDKTVVHEVHPSNGVQSFHADPSTPPASTSFDPFTMASAFYRHVVQGAVGILGSAVSSGGTHQHGVTHAGGAFMRAMNGLHQVLAQPSGALLSAFSGAHTVTANASGVQIASSAAIALQCPPGGLGLPSGGVGSGALAAGAASSNVGTLSGDLAGSLPSPQVVSILHVVGANALPNASNDAAAAALSPPVAVGGLYRNGSQLMVRVA